MNAITAALVKLLGISARLPEGPLGLPAAASESAGSVDRLFAFIFWVSLFFFALIVTLMIVFVVRYRRREGHEPAPSPSHNLPLELTWSIIPLILVIVMFVWGFKAFLDLNTPPANAYEVQVTGQRWKWLFTYPNGFVSEDLHVPVDEPVRLVMTAEDVIHSFYVPAFRMKRDVVPGRYSKVWFRATKAGEYQAYCAEYCGTSHSDMLARVIVHDPGGFEKWLREAANVLASLPPTEAGKALVRMRGCAQCHTVDGKASVGPTFLGVFGHRQPLKSGETITVDEDYVRESILNPQAKVAAGFEPVMPTYKGKLSDKEITMIIEFLKSLKEGEAPAAAGQQSPATPAAEKSEEKK